MAEEKAYKHLCAFVKQDKLFCKYFYKGNVMEFIKHPLSLADNRTNFSEEDLASINEATELFKEAKLKKPDCNKCQHRFICWTHRIK